MSSSHRQKINPRHLCRFLALVIIVWLVNRSHQQYRQEMAEQGQPIELSEARQFFPAAHSLESKEGTGILQVFDEKGELLGTLTQTSPQGDASIGFSGPTNLLVALDEKGYVGKVGIRSSGDTSDHVDAIVETPVFFEQFKGKSLEALAELDDVEAVSGATLTSLAIADALRLRFGGQSQVSRFPVPLGVEEVHPYFVTASKLEPSKTHTGLQDVLDADGQLLGKVGRTSPYADQVVGYQGPVDTMLVLDPDGKLIGMKARSSFENKPYADYPNDDAYFASLFKGRTVDQLAQMDLVAEGVEGVSGATMTSLAMAEGIVKTANAWEKQRLREEQSPPFVNWRLRDTGSLVVILLGGFVAFTRAGKKRRIRLVHQVLLIGYLGLINGDVLSQALFAGWAESGVPWQRAPVLALLTLAALLVPMTTGKAFYCHHLCPHGAAQQWIGKIRKSPIHLPARWGKALELLPVVLLGFVLLVAFHKLEFPLVMLEPFDAYVWEVAGAATITIAIVGLVTSAFVPMAYCRFGCPTGALLKLFESRRNDKGWSRRDYLTFTILGLAILLNSL
jgi:NosR/NirI family nitrous oxide reductase transcriptional regulator